MGSAKKAGESERLARTRTRRHSEHDSESENENDNKEMSDREDEERDGAPKYAKSSSKFGEGMTSFPQTPQRVDFLHLTSPFTPVDQHTSMVRQILDLIPVACFQCRVHSDATSIVKMCTWNQSSFDVLATKDSSVFFAAFHAEHRQPPSTLHSANF
jgi:hypothetical protein